MLFFDCNIPTKQGYICEERFFQHGYTSRPHRHGFVELEFVVSGTGIHQCGDTTEKIETGSAWILSVHDNHKVIYDKEARIINIAVEMENLPKEVNDLIAFANPFIHYVFKEKAYVKFLKLARRLLEEQKEQEILSKVMAQSIIVEMCVELIRSAKASISVENINMMSNVVNWIYANYRKDISLAQLAEAFSLTPNYLGQLIKEKMGISYNDFLNNIRLKSACHELLFSELSVKDIALSTGFNSVQYFNLVFKKNYGVTPSEYRMLTTKKD